jgi:inosine triphosphate pyrophosphatase
LLLKTLREGEGRGGGMAGGAPHSLLLLLIVIAAMAAVRALSYPVVFVTSNANKIQEVQAMLGASGSTSSCSVGIDLRHQAAELPELQGEPLDICRQKCLIAAERLQCAVLVEDTGLCFNALGGLPGPYIKHFLDKTGHEGLNNLLAAYEDKSAYALCIFGFCKGPGEEVHLFEGRATGMIVPARGGGRRSFGWDPIFEPDEGAGGLTFAEMSKGAKNRISHRSKALEKLLTHFQYQR